MDIRLPDRRNIEEVTGVDNTKFYYTPVTGSFFKARFADAVNLLGGRVGRLLDAGCGSGIFLPELSRHCDRLFSFDLHPHLHRTARMSKAERVAVTLTRCDARALPFASESMDAVVSMSMMEHLRDPQSAAKEFYRVLKPGGVAVIGVPVKNLLTDIMFRGAYLSLDGKLEDEHVSTHRDVLGGMRAAFPADAILHIPRSVPEPLRLYTTARFRKPA
jgi:SAM-dependent methyltransferase